MMPARPFSTRVRADTHLRELAPGNLELVGGRHVRHGAAGGEVGQHDFLMRRAENVSALRHEVDATEDDELRGALARGRARQLQRVPGEIGELDDLVALIVMAQDDDAVTERPLGSGDPLVHFVVGKTQVFLGERLALSDALFLDLGEQLDVHSLATPARSCGPCPRAPQARRARLGATGLKAGLRSTA